jgi:hypothetical protein
MRQNTRSVSLKVSVTHFAIMSETCTQNGKLECIFVLHKMS